MVVARTVNGARTETTLSVAYAKGSPIGMEYPVGVADMLTVSTRNYSLQQAIPAGFTRAGHEIGNYLKQLKLIFTPKTEAYKSVGGFIAIGNIFPDTWSWFSFWNITALLSVMLAIVNLLPIPALDGGHVLFQLYEIATRRKPSEKFLERAQIIGMFLLLFLILYANGNDVMKLFSK
jgi:regulator of sigma E protease